MKKEERDFSKIPIAIILSQSSTTKALCQFYDYYEEEAAEGKLCIIHSNRGSKLIKILSRINGIVPHNDFFEKGDAWSEARRKRFKIPTDVSRKFVVGELELLGELSKRGLREVVKPPFPGDEVYELESKNYLSEIFGVQLSKRFTMLFGSLFGYYDMPVPLDLNNITMHLAVLGVTGSGKSYTVGYFVERLSKLRVQSTDIALPTIIVDANGDYLDFFYEFYNKHKFGNYNMVYRFVFSNSMALFEHTRYIHRIKINLSEFSSREVAELVITYYTGGLKNELQISGLETALRRLYDNNYDLSEMFINDDVFDRLISELTILTKKERLIHDQTSKAILRALQKFRDDCVIKYEIIGYEEETTLSGSFIDRITENPSLVIIDFSTDGAPGVSLQAKQLVISYLTKMLYTKFTSYKVSGDERCLLLIIEESQNYCPNLSAYPIGYSLARDNLALIATQGRKFGLCLCLVSQRPSFVDPIVLSMVNTFIIHRISAEDVSFVKKIVGTLPTAFQKKLTLLATGRAIVTGQMNILGFPVIVDIPKREIEPKMGRIDVGRILTRSIF